nr:hypothetical protein 9 [bacterium]
MGIEQIERDREKISYDDWDLIGLSDTKDRMVNVLKYVKPPLTVGFYGKWGTGKTELIYGIMDDLSSRQSESTSTEKYLTLYFDAWAYRKEENIALAVLSKIYNEFLGDTSTEIKESVSKVFRSLFYVGGNAAAKIFTSGTSDISTIEKGLELAEKECEDYIKYIDTVENLKKDYKSLIDKIIKITKAEKIFIFIDNLDRCLPDTVVDLLENISIFLSYKDVSCVYMLAMDKEHVIKAINHRFPDFEGEKYLEKIVNVDLHISVGEGTFDTFVDRYKKTITKSMHRRDNFEEYLKQQWDIHLDDFQYLSDVFSKGPLSIPRRINKIVHQLVAFHKNMAVERKLDFFVVLFFIIFKEISPVVYFSIDWKNDISSLDYMLSISNQIEPQNLKDNTGDLQEDLRKSLNKMSNILLLNEFLHNDEFRFFIQSFAKLFKAERFSEKYFNYACEEIREQAGII